MPVPNALQTHRTPAVRRTAGMAGAPLDSGSTFPGGVDSPWGWYAADMLGLGDGAAVSRWTDLSGGGNDAVQATVGKQPTFKAAIVNGLPVVRFVQASQTALVTAINTAISGNVAVTVIAVLSATAAAKPNNAPWGIGTSAVALQALGPYGSLIASGKYAIACGGGNSYNSTAPSSTSPHVLTVVKTLGAISTTTTVYQNGTLATNGGGSSGSTPAIANAPFSIGAWAGASLAAWWDGDIAAIVVYPRALPQGERWAVEADFGQKYAITVVRQ